VYAGGFILFEYYYSQCQKDVDTDHAGEHLVPQLNACITAGDAGVAVFERGFKGIDAALGLTQGAALCADSGM
jgi:hypothetical protein